MDPERTLGECPRSIKCKIRADSKRPPRPRLSSCTFKGGGGLTRYGAGGTGGHVPARDAVATPIARSVLRIKAPLLCFDLFQGSGETILETTPRPGRSHPLEGTNPRTATTDGRMLPASLYFQHDGPEGGPPRSGRRRASIKSPRQGSNRPNRQPLPFGPDASHGRAFRSTPRPANAAGRADAYVFGRRA